MQTRLVRAIIGLACCALWPAEVAGDPIRLVSGSNRLASASVQLADGTPEQSDVRLSFEQNAAVLTAMVTKSAGTTTAAASAMQSSDISDLLHLSGTGTATASITSGLAGRAVGGSLLSLVFELDTPHLFDFEGAFASSGSQCCDTGIAEGRWSVELDNPFGSRKFDHGTSLDLSRPADASVITERGVLTPGRWHLHLGAGSVASLGTARADFRFTFNLSETAPAVPEPASILLVGSGILGLTRAAQRHGRCNGRRTV
jgi:hypothetical protein